MGGACLRDHRHPWPNRGAGRVVAERRQQSGLAHQPDTPRPHARSHLLRAGGDTDALRLSHCENQSGVVTDLGAHAFVIDVGEPVGHRDHQRLSDAVPIAGRHSDAITIDQRQR